MKTPQQHTMSSKFDSNLEEIFHRNLKVAHTANIAILTLQKTTCKHTVINQEETNSIRDDDRVRIPAVHSGISIHEKNAHEKTNTLKRERQIDGWLVCDISGLWLFD